MTKSRLSLLIVAMIIAAILIAGCTTSNQTSQELGQTASTNASTSSTSSSTSTTASSSPTVSPSRSASPTAATPTPAPSGKIATSIQFDAAPGSVTRGTSISLGIEVLAPTLICGHGAVTVSMGTVTQGDASGCFRTAYYSLDTSGLSPGTYKVTLSYAGDSTYQPSQSTSQITVTA